MIDYRLLTNTYVTYDDSLTEITLLTGDLEQSWKDYCADTAFDISFEEFKKSFITLDKLSWTLSDEDLEYSEYIDELLHDEVLVTQWLDQLERQDEMPQIGEDICIDFNSDVEIWIYRQNLNAFEYTVDYRGLVIAESGTNQFSTFEGVLREALDFLEERKTGLR